MDKIAMLQGFRALSGMIHEFLHENDSENLKVLAFEMEPTERGAPSADPALFSVWQRLWASGDKTAEEAAAIAREFVVHEADWGYDGDGPRRATDFLEAAAKGPGTSQFERWRDFLRAVH